MTEGQSAVLVLSGVRGDTQRYRTFHFYEQLRYAGVPCELSHITDPQLLARFDRARVVILHRVAIDAYAERLVRKVLNRDGLVIGDVDDLVFDPTAFTWIDSPDFQDPVRTTLYQEEMQRYRSMLEICQAVTASTEFLAEQARALDKPTWVHRNGFSLEQLSLSEAAYQQRANHPDVITIGYASGTPTHDRDFEVAKPAIKQTLERHRQAELWLIGPLNAGADWGPLARRIKTLKRIPWRRLPEIQAQFDINLAPLVMDNPFGQSKSEIKYMEAALVQVPTAASPTGAFASAIQSGENGFLSSNVAQWSEHLSRLVEDANLRTTMGNKAFEDVLARYHPSARAIELIATINQIHEAVYQKPLWDNEELNRLHGSREDQNLSSPESWIDPKAMQPPTLARMALYSLRHRGARTMLLQVRAYLRRLITPLVPYTSNRRKEQ